MNKPNPLTNTPWLKISAWVSRILLWLVLAGWLLFTALWGALQVWIVPRIGEFRPELEMRVSEALGVTVRIGAIRAQSDGLIPAFELHDVRLQDALGRDALQLPLVLASLTPRSLWNTSFEQLFIEGPVLDIRRLPDGRIEVAGLDFSKRGSTDSRAADWFFSQREFVIRGGTLRWTDEQRAVPTLALDHVDLVVRNTARSHALRLDANPPPDWGDRFTVMGKFRQPLLSGKAGAWREWSGPLYADVSRLDLTRLGRYVQGGERLLAARGAVRAWADLSNGSVRGFTGDLALSDVEARVDAQREPLSLQSVTGRISVERLAGGAQLSSPNLQFFTHDGVRWDAGNLMAAYTEAQGSTPASGEWSAEKLDLSVLAHLASRLPLGTETHALLASLSPRGVVEGFRGHWQGPLGAPVRFDAQGKVTQLALAAQRSSQQTGAGPSAREAPGRPGLRGGSLDFRFNQNGGSAKLQMAQGAIELPGVLEEPLVPIDQLSTEVQWKITGPRVDVTVPVLKIANADVQGEMRGAWHTADGSGAAGKERFPGVIDLQGSLTRVDGTRVHRYLPTSIPKYTRDYLREAIVAGTASGVRLRLRGDLREAPFTDPRRGEFQIAGQVRNATFAYAPRGLGRDAAGTYPALQQLSGELVIDRNTLEVRDASGRIAGAPGLQITRAQARIPDLSHSTTVVVSADARGPLSEMVGVVNGSPLSALTNQLLARASATGNADLKLRLTLPVTQMDRSRVLGTVTLGGNDVQVMPAVPMLGRARGTVAFSETGVTLSGIQGRFLGGDIRLEGGPRSAVAGAPANAEQVMVFRAQGTVSAEGIRQARELGALARLAQSASGSTPYAAAVSVRRGIPEIMVSSSLQGMALNLPAPLAKAADAALPLRFETALLRESLGAGQKLQDQIVLEVGKVASIAYQRDISGAEPRVLRGAIGVGLLPGESAPLPDEGVVANINFAKIDIDAWESLLSSASGVNIAATTAGRTRSADPALGYLPTSMAIRANELVLEGRKLNNVVVGGSRDGLNWRANVDARELNGYVEYRQPGGAGAGRLYARLARMEIGQSVATDIENTLDEQPTSVPALDIVVEDFELRGKRLGRVEIEAVNRGAGTVQREGGVREWRLTRLNVVVPEATLTASGNWAAVAATSSAAPVASASGRRPREGAERRRTVMNFRMDVQDAGALLKRLGQPGVIRNGKGRMEGQVSWLGSPLALDYPSMSGQLAVNIESGQFLKADPGLAKLLGVLSLQSLPRRLTLDFRDVFSEGFAFDFIRGDARIEQGVAFTNNLQMKGVNAAVLMEGKADLARETQDLKVVIVPEINAGTASLVASVINPAVGLGTFLAQMFLRRPLIQATTQEFHIDGSWADPKMTRVERKTPPPDAAADGKSDTPAPGGQ